MIHIVFQEADIDVLKQAMEIDTTMKGEIFQVRDEWGVGPLAGMDTEEGWNNRLNWWRGLLANSPYGEKLAGSFDDRETVAQIKKILDEDPSGQAWLWVGQNQHDVTGYYWIIPQFRNYQGRVMIVFLNNLPFINEKGQLFYPWGIHDILPREAVKAKKLARPVTISEFELDGDEWKKLSEENAMVRILEGGKKIVGVDERFYDGEILKNMTGEWQKAWRVLSNTLHRMKIKTGDVYIMWRMKKLVADGRVEILGDMEKGWKDFDVRLAGAGVSESNQSEEAIA